MKTEKVTLITCLLAILLWGCGSTTTSGGTSRAGGESGGGSGVNISTRVQDSTPATTSLSAGASVSKELSVNKGSAASSGESEEPIIVAKATVDSGTSAEVTCTKLDGTVLATGTSHSSTGHVTLTIPAGEKQVIIIAKLPDGGEVCNFVNVENIGAGSTVDAGETDPEADFICKQIQKEANYDSSTLASKFAAGAINPIAMAKTIKEMLNESGTAGSDSNGSAQIAMLKAWKEAFANNKVPGFLKNCLSGDASSLATMSGFIGGNIDFTKVNDQLAAFIPAIAKTFDETTYKKTDSSGQYDSIAKTFFNYKVADMQGIIKNPANLQGLIQNSADSYVAGDINSFNAFKNSNCAAMISGLVGNFDPSVFTGDYGAMQKVLQNYKCSNITSSGDTESNWKALGNYFTAMDNPAERESCLKDPTSTGETLFNNPNVYAIDGGHTAAQNIFTVQGSSIGGDFTAFIPCSSTVSCPSVSGLTCNTSLNQCVPSVGGAGACTSNCPIGTACNSAICGTGMSCTNGFCVVSSGLTQKFAGETCNVTSDCLPPLGCKLFDVLRCGY